MSRPSVTTSRWLIRLEEFRPPRFGEPRRASLRFAVRPYREIGNDNGKPIRHFGAPTFFPTLSAAIAWARRDCARLYGERR